MHYRVFDVVISSDIELALPKAAVTDAHIFFSLLSDQPTGKATLLHEWRTDAGELTLSLHGFRHATYAWKLFIPEGGSFFISEDLRLVHCRPDPDADHSTLEHLLLDQVIPRIMAQQGNAVVHGSCVQLVDGRVIAIVGDTGTGKSTLASGFFLDGATLLTDDSFLVRVRNKGVNLVPGYRTLRLWPEVAEEFYSNANMRSMAHYSDKQRIGLEPRIVETDRLDGVLLLESDASIMEICRIESAAERTMMLLSSGFALDPAASHCHSAWLTTYQYLVDAGLPVYRLSFPWDLAQLPAVVARLKEEL